jgi:hypothetical protein
MDKRSEWETAEAATDDRQYHVEFFDGEFVGALSESHARSVILSSHPGAIGVERWQPYRRAFIGEGPLNECFGGADMLLFWCRDSLLPTPDFDDADRRIAESLAIAKIVRSQRVLDCPCYEVAFRFYGAGNPPFGISQVERVRVRAADEPTAIRIASDRLAERLQNESCDRPLDRMFMPVCVAHGDASAMTWQYRRHWLSM